MVSGAEQNLKSGSSAEQASAGSESLTVEQAIANLQQREDLSLCYYAAWWLGKFRVRESVAIEALIAALAEEADQTESGGYPLRRNAARALGKLGDSRAVQPLIDCLDCPDFYVREAAAQSLGKLGDSTCIPKLMSLLDGGLAAALPIPGSPHLTQPYNAVIEALGTLGATEAIDLIAPFLEHPIELVQYATFRAMYQLTQDRVYGDRLITALKGQKLQLRRAALADLGAIAYLNAADAIAETLAENSLKLIALKGLLEHEVKNNSTESSEVSDAATHLMTLMDNLL
ncbi:MULTISPECIES: HEAT repeat domain-containing protein [unclassified Coleofasciculus]|uniref:HEAT repeat domain-containing protein n=1 Tax=unclassified Coleofasciculus TaxID=2692782 RepID=UPI00187EA5F0|nr:MULTISPECIES: HEAT repeat domain-containing protein [unclassified Coleofasciculus]MBE9127035.1 HEAT repeat domain-containing protein [Coleofasciculus sp. LEGE 07081]MBE9147286.1 HEAT repeat domain-containing protein [Coleofasciculus sp. LEGE 07092]